MARPLRIQTDGAWYHVTARGTERRVIFRTDEEYQHFIDLLGALTVRYRVRVHAYVLMPNHFHLVLETPERNLSAAMQWLKTSYSMWFNRRNNRVGPLFQGRFKAELFDPHEAGWEVTRYVHLNPVRVKGWGLDKQGRAREAAGVGPAANATTVRRRIDYLREYRWSSYGAYVGRRAPDAGVMIDDVLALRGRGSEAERRAAYRQYVEEPLRSGLVENPWEQLIGGMVLGAGLLKRLARSVRGDRREQPAVSQLKARPGFEEVVKAMEAIRDEKWEVISQRVGDPGRDIVLEVGRRHCGMTLKELGEAAGGLDYRCVATALRRIRARAEKDPRTAALIRKLESIVTHVKT